MAAIGGSVQDISIGGQLFACTGDGDANVDPGGDSLEAQPNGDGATGRLIVTKKNWKLDSIMVSLDESVGDLDAVQAMADRNHPAVGDDGQVDITATFADGTTREGRGQVVGDIQRSTMNATASLSLQGFGKFRQQ